MTTELATWIVYGAFAAGLAVWLVSVVRAFRVLAATGDDGMVEVARTEVEGERDDVSRRIAEALVSGPAAGLAPFRIASAGPERVSVRTRAGAQIIPLTGGLRAEYLLRRTGSGVRVILRTNRAAERRAARVVLGIAFLLGLPVLLGLTASLLLYVCPASHPATRAQAVQIVHVIHPLWPPFLVLWLGRRNQRVVEESLGQVIDRIRYGPQPL
jgi:hypothetical protein